MKIKKNKCFPIWRTQVQDEIRLKMCEEFGVKPLYTNISKNFNFWRTFFIGLDYYETVFLAYFMSKTLKKLRIPHSIISFAPDFNGYTIFQDNILYHSDSIPDPVDFDLSGYVPYKKCWNLKNITNFTITKSNVNKVFKRKEKWFYLPREMYISWWYEENKEYIKKNLDSFITTSVVCKPDTWWYWGKWIFFIEKDYLNQNFFDYFNFNKYIIQEKIDSYPLIINNIHYDWNIRSMMVYDYIKKDYIITWIVCRYDIDGIPVNISLSAWCYSLEEVCKIIGLSEKYNELSMKIEKISIDIFKRIYNFVGMSDEVQNMFCFDFILDTKWELCLIEVDDGRTGALYELYSTSGKSYMLPIFSTIINGGLK